ncbi:MAG: hypothetical protein JWP89_2735 [Schlesneria sp.]|nr:hypothetical protein [Schlesneria sp.]
MKLLSRVQPSDEVPRQSYSFNDVSFTEDMLSADAFFVRHSQSIISHRASSSNQIPGKK